MLPARHRLRTSADFTATTRGAGAARSGGSLLILRARASVESRPARVGFVVSRQVGGAVVRNRTKRVLRHLTAARITGIPSGVDVVIRATPAAAGATTATLAAELDRALGTVLRRLRPLSASS